MKRISIRELRRTVTRDWLEKNIPCEIVSDGDVIGQIVRQGEITQKIDVQFTKRASETKRVAFIAEGAVPRRVGFTVHPKKIAFLGNLNKREPVGHDADGNPMWE